MDVYGTSVREDASGLRRIVPCIFHVADKLTNVDFANDMTVMQSENINLHFCTANFFSMS